MNELPSTSGSGHDCFGDRVCTNPMCPRHGLDGELERLTAVDKPSSFTLTRPGMGHGRAHHTTVELMPVAEHEALVRKYERLSAMWKDSETRVDLAN
jgi:hypothetical protein